MVFQGYSLTGDGSLHVAELKGPSNFEEWYLSWQVFKTAAIMIGFISPETLERYGTFIKRMHTTYGARCWLLLYQADMRYRLEEAERVRRRGEDEAARASDPALAEYDGNFPWEYVYAKAQEQTKPRRRPPHDLH